MAGERDPVQRNVDLTGSDFSGRLRDLRLRRRLTKTELAARAHLSARTIQDLEKGRRPRILVKTLLLLADALEVSYEELLGPAPAAGGNDDVPAAAGPPPASPSAPPPPSRSRRFRPLAFLALGTLVVLLPASLWLYRQATLGAEVRIENGDLVVRDGLLGTVLWTYDSRAEVVDWLPAPWDGDLVVIGLAAGTAPDEAPLVVAERRSGRIAWRGGSDDQLWARAFTRRASRTQQPRDFKRAVFLDLDGDGRQELAAQIDESRDRYSFLCILDADGTPVGEYCHRGWLQDLLAHDLDDDGKDELLAAGQNTSPAVRGASVVLLDDVCCHGASLDSLSGDRGGLPDSARVRLVLPSFGRPYMGLLGTACLQARGLRIFRSLANEPRVGLEVGCRDENVILTLDGDLRPLLADPTDMMRGASEGWPDGLRGTGPADPAWLAGWLTRAVRLEAGHYRPGVAP